MHLNPEHLGAMTLTVDVRAGHVRLGVTGGETALDALRSGMGGLRDQLAASGLQLDDVRLQTSADTGQGRPDQQRPATADADVPGRGQNQGQDRGQDQGQAFGQSVDAGDPRSGSGRSPLRERGATPDDPVSPLVGAGSGQSVAAARDRVDVRV
jgi:flagellar hook-length control protein FliK